MNISTKKWHYKEFTRYSNGWSMSSTSLCKYFWQVVASLLLTTILWTLAICVLFAIVNIFMGVGFAIHEFMFGLDSTYLDNFMYSMEVLSAGFIVFILLSLLATAMIWLALWVLVIGSFVYGLYYLAKKLGYKKKESNESNIFIEYIKARKNKVCPIVTFDDE